MLLNTLLVFCYNGKNIIQTEEELIRALLTLLKSITMKNLILVESPTKARTLTRFLKGKYDIQASMGHVRDLPKGKLGVDIEHGFEPQYVIPKDKRKTVENLRDIAKDANKIILATDPDREGEAISFHLQILLATEAQKATFSRIVFHEITEEAIQEALKHPRAIDNHLVAAQTARRVLDRIVGYKLSPLLWKKIKRNLSAGRVQSIALRLIVEREREIEKFQKENYYRIFVVLQKENGKRAEFELVETDGNKIEKTEKLFLYDGEYKFTKTTLSKVYAEKILQEVNQKKYTVTDVTQKDTKRSPYPPFITSSLQIDAARRLGFAGRRTMNTAQKLYEEGFITYHRTDSYNISNQFLKRAHSFIIDSFGKKYLQIRTFRTKSKVAQEAHEAIRPTSVGDLTSLRAKVQEELGNDAAKLYELIFKRTLATQMADAIFKSTKIQVKTNGYVFEKSGSILVFDGFLKIWFYEEDEELLPEFVVGEMLAYQNGKVTEHITNPPPRYNEASLVGTLEKNGIGRPSTYATIVSTIQERNYVEKEENRFKPTAIGITVSDFLVKNFGEVDDIPFTANMENMLDAIANGEREWKPMMQEFYTPFEKELTKAESEAKIEVAAEKTGELCPKDNGDVIIRYGRFGKFKACSNFPTCNYTAPLVEETQYICPKDHGKVVMKKTRRARTFFGCSNYPKCKFAVWNKNQLLKEINATPSN